MIFDKFEIHSINFPLNGVQFSEYVIQLIWCRNVCNTNMCILSINLLKSSIKFLLNISYQFDNFFYKNVNDSITEYQIKFLYKTKWLFLVSIFVIQQYLHRLFKIISVASKQCPIIKLMTPSIYTGNTKVSRQTFIKLLSIRMFFIDNLTISQTTRQGYFSNNFIFQFSGNVKNSIKTFLQNN